MDAAMTTPRLRRIRMTCATSKGEAERLVVAADGPGFRTVSNRPRAIIGPDDAVLLAYTAGHTDVPKGAVHTQASLLAQLAVATWAPVL